VSGMAYAFGRPLLMLAHAPYESPIDYRDLLVVHKTAASCTSAVENWLISVEHN